MALKKKFGSKTVKDESAKVAAPKVEPPVVAEKTAPSALPLYVVAETWQGSIRGAITTMTKGKKLNPRHYGGEVGVNALKKAGLKLEEAEE